MVGVLSSLAVSASPSTRDMVEGMFASIAVKSPPRMWCMGNRGWRGGARKDPVQSFDMSRSACGASDDDCCGCWCGIVPR